MDNTTSAGPARMLATIEPMLPLPVALDLMRGIGQFAARAGCRDVTIGDGLKISGVLPGPGARPEYHHIELVASRRNRGLLGWRCSCLEDSEQPYGDLGDATAAAVRHVPDGQRWTVEPDDQLITEPGR